MEKIILRAENISKNYENQGFEIEVIQEASLTIREGEFVMIVGPSGSGKSTLLYVLSGLRKSTSGQVFFETRPYCKLKANDLTQLRYTKYGFIMQQHLLVPYLNCIENVCLGRTRDLEDDAKRMLAELGLAKHFYKYPHELSFGERQRVAVVRGLVHNPRLLFADEPTASVNNELAQTIVNYLESYRNAGGSCIMVTHDLSLLPKATKVFTLQDGILVEQPHRGLSN